MDNIKDSGKITVTPVKHKDMECNHEDCDCLIDSEQPTQEIEAKWEFKPRQNPRWGVVTREGLVVGRGKNKKVIPPDDVYRLAALGCDLQEMSDWFGINRETLKYNFTEYINRGRADLKHRLRRAQIKTALDGNPTLLIWLGKQYLGQSDNPGAADSDKILPWTD